METLHNILYFDLYDLIHIPYGILMILVFFLYGISMITNAVEHGMYYAKGRTEGVPEWIRTMNIHLPDLFQEWAYAALAFLTGVPVLLVLSAEWIFRPFFQMIIDVSCGIREPFWKRGEYRKWYIYKNIWVPRFAIGKVRLVQAFLGVLIIVLYIIDYLY